MTFDSTIPDELGSPYTEGAPRTPEREQARSELDLMSDAMVEEKGLLNHAQAGLLLGVSVKRIGELVRSGKLRRFDFLGRTYVSSAPASIGIWLDRHTRRRSNGISPWLAGFGRWLPRRQRMGISFAGNGKFWREARKRYRWLGRCEMLPIRSTAEAVSRYTGGYIAKHMQHRREEDKGVKLVRYGKGMHWVRSRLAFNSLLRASGSGAKNSRCSPCKTAAVRWKLSK